MKKLILGIGLSLVIACAPELRSGKGERCDELGACEEGFECYRGFCVAEEGTSEPAPIVEDSDAGVGEGSDAGSASARPTHRDASTSASQEPASPPSDADDADPPMSKPVSAPAVTNPPATAGEPGGRAASPDARQAPPPDKKPAPAPTSPPAAVPAVPDAGAGVDAAVSLDAAVSVGPDAAFPLPTLPRNCTVQDCCEEALRSQRGAANDGKGGKACGCSDPALVPALLGALTCTVGGVVGGLL